ncbi:MAG: hypothetical protein ACIARR_04695 [Phycisphaerales bacterium JB059]
MTHTTLTAAAGACLLASIAGEAVARDWYVCAATGKGKTGTIDKPAKDLGNIITKLEAGDRVFIAEGEYLGRGSSGHDEIKVPVEIYGGWSQDFTARDPWGAHKTVLSGDNMSKNWKGMYRLKIDARKWFDDEPARIVVDGVIIDNAPRNRYKTDDQVKIVRTANPKTGQNPTPGTGGIYVVSPKQGEVVVRNCVVTNTAPTEGAFSLWGHQNSTITCENNLATNNTGNGFSLHSIWHSTDGLPQFTFNNNSSLFNEKPGPGDSDGGSALKLEADSVVVANANVFAFNDRFGVDNGRQARGVVLNNNIFAACTEGEYLEFDIAMSLDVIEDEPEHLDEAEGNEIVGVAPPVSENWARKYFSRVVVDRNAAEADVKVEDTAENQLRSMLGLPLQGTSLGEYSEVWLPRMTVADAIASGAEQFLGSRGCRNPGTSSRPALPRME